MVRVTEQQGGSIRESEREREGGGVAEGQDGQPIHKRTENKKGAY